MVVKKASIEDLKEILDLQYLAYQSEAELLDNYDIPPLKQTLKEVESEYCRGIILKVLNEDDIIVGSVRGYVDGGTLHVGKLIVHPDFQGRGIGRRLLSEIEQSCTHQRCELFTSTMSQRNIDLYKRVGYSVFKHTDVSDGLRLVYLEK